MKEDQQKTIVKRMVKEDSDRGREMRLGDLVTGEPSPQKRELWGCKGSHIGQRPPISSGDLVEQLWTMCPMVRGSKLGKELLLLFDALRRCP